MTVPAGVPGIDAAGVTAWFAAHVPQARPPLRFELIPGGRSNLTFTVNDSDGARFVLRRPPLGPLLPSAHDMAREHRIMSALAGSAVPVPPVLGLCTDESVTGAPFFVTRFVDGLVLRNPEVVAATGEPLRRAAAESLVDTLVDLHATDPDVVGLGGLGRRTGYAERLVRRWRGQWERSKTRDLPLVEEVADRLAATIPPETAATVVHGDYRLDNVIVGPGDGGVRAVLDWELCTLGEPLADVGLLMCYWSEPGDASRALSWTPTAAPGFPGRADLCERYAKRSGRDLAALSWFVALAHWKVAVILEGVHARYSAGAYRAGGDGGDGGDGRQPDTGAAEWDLLADAVPGLAERAAELLVP